MRRETERRRRRRLEPFLMHLFGKECEVGFNVVQASFAISDPLCGFPEIHSPRSRATTI